MQHLRSGVRGEDATTDATAISAAMTGRGAMARVFAVAMMAGLFLLAPRSASAYSVLAHESLVDATWTSEIVPLLKQRYPDATEADLLRARAFAYGGCIIQDLGYYPFGSRLFTNLTHYVRAGDFVETLIRDARDVNELAFAIGALAHEAADNAGHPLAVNVVVPLEYPKDRAKYGDEVLYVESPKHHLMTEFAYDVVQVAHGGYAADAYHAFVGFEVAKDLLERAFKETYGLDLDDLFLDVDLAIGTYRWAVGKLIPDMTRVAWKEKREEIEKASPGVTAGAFVYRLQRREFEQQFGVNYREPGWFSKFLALVIRVLPKIGPLRALAFKPLTPEAERLFVESAERARIAYVASLRQVRARRLMLANTDFDTGKAVRPGVNPLADETVTELAKRRAETVDAR
jgi:hypothetical protein